ncbi:MAG: TonB-dependent receptor [Bacteroidetes bacterium]|nr:TonB-dependent receptor [Bacteroidota bacterium]
MKKITLMLAMIGFLGFQSLYAQQPIRGTVTNSDDGGTIPGVSIIIKGTANGTTTNFDGDFSINATLGQVLVVSYIGFKSQEVEVTANVLNIQLVFGVNLSEVVVIGSRNPNRTATESMVPIDIIDIKEIANVGAQINLNQILNYVAPSFSSNTQSITDGTDHIDPASLRGLGPDQVLVLINGKRRHSSSLVNVNGSFGKGSVGTDLNAIPASAIQRIEVLRDGAAAQYGSDAIAGVINIVLNKTTNELVTSITTGANFTQYANDQTGGVDGETTNVAGSYGVDIGNKGGYLNFSGDFDIRNPYGRMKEYEATIFNLYNTVERVASDAGYDISKLLDDDVSDVIQYATAAGIDLNGATSKTDLRSILSADNTEAELAARGQERSDYNMRIGQSSLRGGRLFANFSMPLNDLGWELYSFAGISSRIGNSAGYYRLPNQSRTYTPAYINGFLPEINSTVQDQSFAVGIKGMAGKWNVDFSNTYGRNSFMFNIGNTFNASLQNVSPTYFDAGGFAFAQNTTNLDINQSFEEILAGVNVAFGSEYRIENYQIIAGEEGSYARYTDAGEIITLPTQQVSVDFFGNPRAGGSQVFPGFSPSNELSRGRNSIAGYFDVDAKFSDAFSASFATRYEDYSDFGSTTNVKLATLLKVASNLNIRAAANSGFRAPSLHQINFNSTSTFFSDGVPTEVGTFSNDSRAAQLLGIPSLKQETSQSVSLGLTTQVPAANLTVTADAYYVKINNRIVYTGQFQGSGTGSELDNLLSMANAAAASFFANAIDTESRGLDVVITQKTRVGDKWKLNSDLAATFSQTRKVGDIHSSQVLEDAGLVDTYLNEQNRIYLEDAVPGTKINLSNTLSSEKFVVFLRNVYFGEVTEANSDPARQQVFGSKIVTDLSVSYKATQGLTFTLGANNIFDIFPEVADPAYNNRNSGRFHWSRTSLQYGIGGRFLFARVSLSLK